MNINEVLNSYIKKSNRIIITKHCVFNPKKKKGNVTLVDVSGLKDIEILGALLVANVESAQGAWMSPVDVYINFMHDQALISHVGIVLDNWVRCGEFKEDYQLEHNREFQKWLQMKLRR